MRRPVASGALAVGLVTWLFQAVGGQSKAPLALAGRIPLGTVAGRIDHLAVDVTGRRLFVAALGNDTVEVIDLNRRAIVGEIKGLHHPQGLGFIPTRNLLVVAQADDPVVRFYDGKSLTVVHELKLGEDCDNVRVDASAGRVYVGYGDGAIAVIDLEGRKLADIQVGGHPESFQLESNGSRIFVNVPTREEIAVIDRAAQKVVARWKVTAAAANFPMAHDEAHRRLFVGCRRPARLVAIDTESGSAVAQLDTIGDTDDLFLDAPQNLVYVIGGGGAVAIVDVSGLPQELARVNTSSGARTGLWVADLRQLFVAAPRRGGSAAEILIYGR